MHQLGCGPGRRGAWRVAAYPQVLPAIAAVDLDGVSRVICINWEWCMLLPAALIIPRTAVCMSLFVMYVWRSAQRRVNSPKVRSQKIDPYIKLLSTLHATLLLPCYSPRFAPAAGIPQQNLHATSLLYPMVPILPP